MHIVNIFCIVPLNKMWVYGESWHKMYLDIHTDKYIMVNNSNKIEIQLNV